MAVLKGFRRLVVSFDVQGGFFHESLSFEHHYIYIGSKGKPIIETLRSKKKLFEAKEIFEIEQFFPFFFKRPEFRVQSPESRVQRPESRVQRTESRVQNPESRVQSPESRVQSPSPRVQGPESRVQSSESRVQSPESRDQSRVQYRFQTMPEKSDNAKPQRAMELSSVMIHFRIPNFRFLCMN